MQRTACTLEREGPQVVVRVVGVLDEAGAEVVGERWLEAVGQVDRWVLHLGGVGHLDWAGVRLLMRIAADAQRRGGRLKIVPPPEPRELTVELALVTGSLNGTGDGGSAVETGGGAFMDLQPAASADALDPQDARALEVLDRELLPCAMRLGPFAAYELEQRTEGLVRASVRPWLRHAQKRGLVLQDPATRRLVVSRALARSRLQELLADRAVG